MKDWFIVITIDGYAPVTMSVRGEVSIEQAAAAFDEAVKAGEVFIVSPGPKPIMGRACIGAKLYGVFWADGATVKNQFTF